MRLFITSYDRDELITILGSWIWSIAP